MVDINHTMIKGITAIMQTIPTTAATKEDTTKIVEDTEEGTITAIRTTINIINTKINTIPRDLADTVTNHTLWLTTTSINVEDTDQELTWILHTCKTLEDISLVSIKMKDNRCLKENQKEAIVTLEATKT